jgi:CysZ protein
MISNPIAGAQYLLRGFGLLNKPGVRAYVIVPLLINITLFTLLFALVAGQFEVLIDLWLPTLPEWLGWLEWLVWLLFGIMAAIIVFFTFSLVANLVGAPFNGYLAAAVEAHLTGNKPTGPERGIGAEIVIALQGELRKLVYFLLWAALVLALTAFLSLTVVLAWLSPFLWALFGAWMLAAEYMDYPMGNHGLAFRDQRQQLAKQRLLSLGFGGAATVATLIPIVQFLVMPASVAGATALWVERFAPPSGGGQPGA